MTAGPESRPIRGGGFTLLELLVAMAILAVVGALALGGLNTVIGQQEIARRQLDRLHQVQRAVRIITGDISQLNPRYVRDQLGTHEPPVIAPCGVEYIICLSRDGWRNPFAQFQRGTLQRVQYRLQDNQLIREYWSVMDRTLINEPRREVLLDDVDRFELYFLDPESSDEPLTEWPPLNTGATAAGGLPGAVRIAFSLRDWGEIERIVEVVQ